MALKDGEKESRSDGMNTSQDGYMGWRWVRGHTGVCTVLAELLHILTCTRNQEESKKGEGASK